MSGRSEAQLERWRRIDSWRGRIWAKGTCNILRAIAFKPFQPFSPVVSVNATYKTRKEKDTDERRPPVPQQLVIPHIVIVAVGHDCFPEAHEIAHGECEGTCARLYRPMHFLVDHFTRFASEPKDVFEAVRVDPSL